VARRPNRRVLPLCTLLSVSIAGHVRNSDLKANVVKKLIKVIAISKFTVGKQHSRVAVATQKAYSPPQSADSLTTQRLAMDVAKFTVITTHFHFTMWNILLNNEVTKAIRES